MSNWFVDDMYYLERVARIPYSHPGSKALGEVVCEKAKQANVLMLANHGGLVYFPSFREAQKDLHTLEMVHRMQVTASNANL